jgi:hypothetical protein
MKLLRSKFLVFVIILAACNAPSASPIAAQPPAAVIAEAKLAPITIVDVPSSVIQIDGVSYVAYQTPDDPWRFLCQEPCTVDPNLIFAQYAGFRSAHETMITLTGVNPLPELLPVDFHLTNDATCGNLADSPALAFAHVYSDGNAYVCTFLFEYAQGVNGPYTAEDAVQLYNQTIFIHEYLHAIFPGRFPSDVDAFHDFVTPLAVYIGQGEMDLCGYHPETPPGDFGGYLIVQLCEQNGFQMEDLAASLIAVDNLYQSGGGQLQEGYQHPAVSMAQYRQILNNLLGSDTRQAFADACWPAELFGDSYTLSDACLYPTPAPSPTPLQ